MEPVISVIIPCFKQAWCLPEAVDSVLKQTYSNWELIIVNDGSPDNVSSIAEEFTRHDSRIRYLEKENGGVSSARNAGISIARGVYIITLDADDKISPEYLETAITFLEKNKEISVYSCMSQFFGDKNGLYSVNKYSSYKVLLLYNSIIVPSIFRKKDWKRIGGFDESMKTGFEDWEFWIRLLYKNDSIYISNSTMAFYRFVNNKKDNLSGHMMDYKFHIDNYIYEKNIDIYKEYFGDPILLLSDYVELKTWSKRRIPTLLRRMMLSVQRIITKY